MRQHSVKHIFRFVSLANTGEAAGHKDILPFRGILKRPRRTLWNRRGTTCSIAKDPGEVIALVITVHAAHFHLRVISQPIGGIARKLDIERLTIVDIGI